MKRPYISLLLAAIFIGLGITGALSYSTAYSPALAGTHTLFGLTLLLIAGFHIYNNWRPLTNHTKTRRALVISITAATIIILGGYLSLPPFSQVIEFGYQLRQIEGVEEEEVTVISTRSKTLGKELLIDVRAGAYYESSPQPLFLGITITTVPQVVFWLEDDQGNYLETLYLTKSLSDSSFTQSPFDEEVIRRVEALPVWSHQRNKRSSDGLLIPDSKGAVDLDGLTAPTPTGHYQLRTRIPANKKLHLMMEINRSFDFNEFYTEDRYPDDPIYSGSGFSGQPSVIYRGIIEPNGANKQFTLEAVGHGHHSGQTGELFSDLSEITTALQLVRYVFVDLL